MRDAQRGEGAWRAGGYVAEELIGRGASADVWRGRQTRTGAAVALKRIPLTGRQAVHSARAEAAVLAGLSHPHLIGFRELVPDGDAVVLVLDFAPGGSLAALIERRRFLAPGEVVTALAPICAALAYAHNEGLVHCDVSTSNVLFAADGKPLLADLGVARLLDGAAAVSGSAEHAGTVGYLDPAVAAGAAPGPASDVFAAAAVALHALTGAPAWPAQSVTAAISLAAGGEIPDLADRLAGTPAPLRRVLQRALSIEPFRRGSAAELALDLRHSASPVPVELNGGRIRAAVDRPARHVPRHSASAPLPAADSPSAGLLTYAVRRAADQPDPTPRRGRLPRPPRRVLIGAVFLIVLLGLAGAAAVVLRAPHDSTQRNAQPDRSVGGPTMSSAGGAATSIPASTSATRTTGSTASADLAAVLADLDARRATAYATRNAQLLAEVYVPGTLLAQDNATLYRTVPVGCVLVGLHTRYTALRAVARTDRTVQVSTLATLAESRLMCHGVQTQRSAGLGPVRMMLELTRAAGGYRIGRLTVASPG